MGMNYYVVGKSPTVRTPIHIGKSSIGWKFLGKDKGWALDDSKVRYGYELAREEFKDRGNINIKGRD